MPYDGLTFYAFRGNAIPNAKEYTRYSQLKKNITNDSK